MWADVKHSIYTYLEIYYLDFVAVLIYTSSYALEALKRTKR